MSIVIKELNKLKPKLVGCLEDGDCQWEEGYCQGYKQAKADIRKLLKKLREGER